MTEDNVGASMEEYLRSIEQRLQMAEYRDSDGKLIREFRPAERHAVADAMTQVISTMRGGGATRVALTLAPEARKEVVVYLGLLPLFVADAQATSRRITLLAPDGDSEARWNNRRRSLVVLEPNLDFACWYQLEPLAEYGFRRQPLDGLWIIGDLDYKQGPAGDYLAAAQAAVRRVMETPSCPAMLIHQEGSPSIVPLPSTLPSGPAPVAAAAPSAGSGGGCFIATAACGTADAPDVAALRGWRDRVLARSSVGRVLVRSYARLSPPIAGWIEPRPWARRMVRGLLIRPAARWLGGRESGAENGI